MTRGKSHTKALPAAFQTQAPLSAPASSPKSRNNKNLMKWKCYMVSTEEGGQPILFGTARNLKSHNFHAYKPSFILKSSRCHIQDKLDLSKTAYVPHKDEEPSVISASPSASPMASPKVNSYSRSKPAMIPHTIPLQTAPKQQHQETQWNVKLAPLQIDEANQPILPPAREVDHLPPVRDTRPEIHSLLN